MGDSGLAPEWHSDEGELRPRLTDWAVAGPGSLGFSALQCHGGSGPRAHMVEAIVTHRLWTSLWGITPLRFGNLPVAGCSGQ